MIRDFVKPAIAEFLLSVGAEKMSSGEFNLPLDTWLKQRETIDSIQKGTPGTVRRASIQVTFSCAFCGKTGVRSAYETKKKIKDGACRMFCSMYCSGKGTAVEQGRLIFHKCKTCEVQIPAKSASRFCSEACRKVAFAKGGLKRRDPNKNPDTWLCQVCGVMFQRGITDADLKRGHLPQTCSKACWAVVHSKRMSGKGNPTYRHGLGHLDRWWSIDWQNNKPIVKDRDHFKCVVCKSKEFIEVHHINMLPTDHAIDNLVVMCRKCHRHLHGLHKSKLHVILWPWLKKYAEAASFMIFKSRGQAASLQMAS
jgi:5-methylcytosine-specific restriction endonuclease McrA